jgi:hypothetical protein
MSDQQQMRKPTTDQAQQSGQNTAPTANSGPDFLANAQAAIDDVLSGFAPAAASAATIGATEQRPEVRSMSAEEFVRRFRQETGE